MFRINRLINQTRASLITSKQLLTHEHKLFPQHYAQKSSTRFLDIYQLGNKQAVEKERARLADEMNRGYFADVAELKKHGGKIATANKIIIPALAAVKFPDLDVSYSDGTPLKLPVCSSGDVANADKAAIPKAMVDSWSTPFFEAFSDSKNVHLYEVSFIDSWLLCRSPIKRILLKIMRKSKDAGENVLQRQIVYSFGDHYYFRKELKILNLLTGYFFLLDKFGRIRWQGFGMATPEELSSLLSCTSLLLEGE
ncbi:mitochondrial ATPase complex subunit ATP10 [Citrus sinensis]|nr:mitochondrial ATPase complex subunit ATP10 [Citrus sinensis]